MGVTGPTATMIITNGLEKAVSEPSEIQIATYSPGIFTLAQNGEGQAIVTFAGTADLAAPLGTVGASRPATAGDLLTVYANGLGPVEPPIENGHNSCEPDGVCLPDGSNVVLRHTTMTPVIPHRRSAGSRREPAVFRLLSDLGGCERTRLQSAAGSPHG